MKRNSSLIEDLDGDDILETFGKRNKAISEDCKVELEAKMHRNTIWYKSLLGAEKSCIKDDTVKKVHYLLEDGREMVEEYNLNTKVLLRRAWKVKSKLGGDGKWDVEIGDPVPDATPNVDALDIVESKDQPTVLRRNTRVNLEWRIRNLPYPIETYSISANNEDKCMIVRTTNKKYFKKLRVPELERLGLLLEQANISSSHKYNTLIILYKKPQQLMDMEKDLYEEMEKVKPNDVPNPNDCKTQ